MTDAASNPYASPNSNLETSEGGYANLSIFTPSGRLGRMRFLVYSFGVGLLGNIFLTIAQMVMGVSMDPATIQGSGLPAAFAVVMIVIMLGVLVINLFITIKRLHDLDMSGWWVLMFLVPLLNVLFWLYLLLAPGTDGPNRFGPPPPPNSGAVNFFGWIIILLYILALVGIFAAILIPIIAGGANM